MGGPDGQEFFYKDVNAGTLMAVSVETDTTFRASAPELLFDVPAGPGGGVQYDVAPDGQRFLFILSTDDGSAAPQINVVLDWFQELTEHVPVRVSRQGKCVEWGVSPTGVRARHPVAWRAARKETE